MASSRAGLAWESPIGVREKDPVPDVAPAVLVRRRSPGVRPAVAAGVLVLSFLGAWLGVVLRLKTPDGVLVLEGVPKDSEIFIDGEKVAFRWPGVTEPVEIRRVPGQHQVEVRSDGFRTFSEVLTLKADGVEQVRVRLERLAEARGTGGLGIGALRQVVLRSPEERQAQVIRGTWTRQGGDLVQTSLARNAELVFGDRNWSHYDLSLEVKKDTRHTEGQGQRFTILFHHLNHKTRCLYSGYNGAHEIASVVDGRWSRDWDKRKNNWVWNKDELQDGRWYPVKIEVRGKSVKCYFGNNLMFQDSHPTLDHGWIGLGSWRAQVRFRRIKVTDPDGAVLFEGLPEIDSPADAAGGSPAEPTSATRPDSQRTVSAS